ncbi:related to Survival factor 1 [Saccharomycodes ludwigii]|uniref:Related to Survival factor 1 n=1 Tax=Saccharomycodes ludwigii TaxID=36035 RepID=A0A376B3Q6_9ASCO|nr:hypothetical protein SCDLUD_004697 [Saccharomycodes ludwigii]KAH3899262.1 hypothetical protein SCDLUD_004697 [Saccharomycodes ludwigii]SSD59297.1 related to Survival factor 1 [Saccharomycodes ludwigii]
MLKWIQGSISSVTGLAEPEYGTDHIHPCTKKSLLDSSNPFVEATSKDFHWQVPENTNVETSTFYFKDFNKGYIGFAQVIHSNIGGLHTTAQFTFKLYNYLKKPSADSKDATTFETIWASNHLDEVEIINGNFYSDSLKIEWIDNDTKIHFVSDDTNDDLKVDLTFTKIAPGVKVGEDPTTYYGPDIENSWGRMRHVFWPRNECTGTITLPGDHEVIEFDNSGNKAIGMFVMALQGMKPHHAAKSWNFMNFVNEHYSAVLMEFVTPKSYGNTKVSVGIVVKDDKILSCTVDNDCQHLDCIVDSVGWSCPTKVVIDYNGVYNDSVVNTPFHATLEGSLGDEELVERVDVMKEIPTFIKNIVTGVAGTKPYIYQYCSDFTLTIKKEGNEEDGKEREKGETDIVEHGVGWFEFTFILEESADNADDVENVRNDDYEDSNNYTVDSMTDDLAGTWI